MELKENSYALEKFEKLPNFYISPEGVVYKSYNIIQED